MRRETDSEYHDALARQRDWLFRRAVHDARAAGVPMQHAVVVLAADHYDGATGCCQCSDCLSRTIVL